MLTFIKTYSQKTVLGKLYKHYTQLHVQLEQVDESDKDIRELVKGKIKLELSKVLLHFDALRRVIPAYTKLNGNNYYKRLQKPKESDGLLFTLTHSKENSTFEKIINTVLPTFEEQEQSALTHIQETVSLQFEKAFKQKLFKDCVQEAKEILDTDLAGVLDTTIYDLATLKQSLKGVTSIIPSRISHTTSRIIPILELLAKQTKTDLVIEYKQ